MADQIKPTDPKRDQKEAVNDIPEKEVAPKNAEEVKGGGPRSGDLLPGRH